MKLFAVLLFLFLAGETLAATCLSGPATISKGSSCGTVINCKYGLYCSQMGICETAIGVGGACNSSSQCIFGATCKGFPTQMTCIALASPGEACSGVANTTSPDCGSGLVCSSNVCLNGKVGDTCRQANNCQTNICNAVCQPLSDYASCTGTYMCKSTSYCNSTFLAGLCLPLQTSGPCTSSAQCAYGYFCAGAALNDNNPQCVAYGTRAAGQWCGDSSSNPQNSLCSTKRCVNNYCAKSALSVCQGASDCDSDQFCACDGIVKVSGYGNCQSNPCITKTQAFFNCSAIACRSSSSFDYSGSCYQGNCASQLSAYITCNSSSSLEASFFISFAVVFFALFFSRK